MREMKMVAEQGFEAERKRVEAVVETLATLRGEGDSLAELAHDARNMVTALGLYCDLLEEPGVLAAQFTHYGNELRLVAAASRRLVEKLVSLDVRGNAVRRNAGRGQFPSRPPATLEALQENAAAESNTGRVDPAQMLNGLGTGASTGHAAGTTAVPATISATIPGAFIDQAGRWDLMPPELISNLAHDLLACRNLLSALAGPSIALSVDVEGGALPVRLNAEDLTRVLVNLVKNAAEAMPGGGSIRIGLRKRNGPGEAGAESGREAIHPGQELSLTVEDSGPGIPRKALERIFEAGFTTHAAGTSAGTAGGGGWPYAHRGLGLSISRSIVEAAGGRIYATNREGPGTPGRGARFEIVLPVRNR